MQTTHGKEVDLMVWIFNWKEEGIASTFGIWMYFAHLREVGMFPHDID